MVGVENAKRDEEDDSEGVGAGQIMWGWAHSDESSGGDGVSEPVPTRGGNRARGAGVGPTCGFGVVGPTGRGWPLRAGHGGFLRWGANGRAEVRGGRLK